MKKNFKCVNCGKEFEAEIGKDSISLCGDCERFFNARKVFSKRISLPEEFYLELSKSPFDVEALNPNSDGVIAEIMDAIYNDADSIYEKMYRKAYEARLDFEREVKKCEHEPVCVAKVEFVDEPEIIDLSDAKVWFNKKNNTTTLKIGDKIYTAKKEKGDKMDAEKGLMSCLLKACGITTTQILKLLGDTNIIYKRKK